MKILVALLVLSLLGNILGAYVLYKFMQKDKLVQELTNRLEQKDRVLDTVNRQLGRRLVFLHHSVGRNWLSEGGLKDSLIARGVAVRSITYGTPIGEDTDLNHWVPKFESHLDQILRFDDPSGALLPDSLENDIIMFKSCYPNSDIIAVGEGDGDPLAAERTLANYRAVMARLEPQIALHPDKQFIYVTAPPLTAERTTAENAARARQFNQWMTGEFTRLYREHTGLNNFFVFDLFDVLADPESNTLRQEFQRRANDSHPNPKGSQAATRAFLKFLDEDKIGLEELVS
ncbi:MAG: SGNH/GDSL hydrolase family protein [candidate division Zixibacteria bacterium]|nr:SGNH/GDSL hydrolase family protein [candidate division Zixibacteria bacterium]